MVERMPCSLRSSEAFGSVGISSTPLSIRFERNGEKSYTFPPAAYLVAYSTNRAFLQHFGARDVLVTSGQGDGGGEGVSVSVYTESAPTIILRKPEP